LFAKEELKKRKDESQLWDTLATRLMNFFTIFGNPSSFVKGQGFAHQAMPGLPLSDGELFSCWFLVLSVREALIFVNPQLSGRF
jgi:hypothetical protein